MIAATEPGRISLLLGRVRDGDGAALGMVFDTAYGELLSIAKARLRSSGRTACDGLDTTGLVHEVFVRLAARGDIPTENRAHFFRYAGRVMRSILVDCVREQAALRRGGGAPHEPLSGEEAPGSVRAEEFLRVNDALAELAQVDPQLAELLQMRFYAGLTEEEIAEGLGVTERTVRRRWEKARAFMFEVLGH